MRYLSFVLVICIYTQVSKAQTSAKLNYEIDGMTMAITNMKPMLAFYSNVFDIQFKEQSMFGAKLYSGQWGELNLLFCPAEIAGNTATQNRHQFDVIVPDLDEVIALTSKYGGTMMGDRTEDEISWSIGVYDPDNNSILFKQLKN